MSWATLEWSCECETYVSVEIPGYCRCQQHRISTEESCGDCLFVLQMMEMEGCCYQCPLHLSQFHHKQRMPEMEFRFQCLICFISVIILSNHSWLCSNSSILTIACEKCVTRLLFKGLMFTKLSWITDEMRILNFYYSFIHSFINLVCVHIHIHMHVVWRGYVYHNGSVHVKITKLHNLWKCFLSFIMWVPEI